MRNDDHRDHSSTLPTGAVTFLLTDVERSSEAWESDPEDMATAVARHYEILSDAISRYGGVRPVEQGEGDSVLAAFASATDAIAAAISAQRGIKADTSLAVRMAIHTGEAQLRDERNYWGTTINRAGRLRGLAHGGQTILSRATYELVVDDMPEATSLKDLGPQRMRGFSRGENVWQVCHADLPDDFPPLRSLESLPNNLPVRSTSFIGREAEMAEVKEQLSSTRLLTLTGAGGCGKTRLCLEAAADLEGTFPDGLCWVDLAPIADASLVAKAVATALSVLEVPTEPIINTLIRALSDKSLLILLDNCEHVIDVCADLVQSLISGTPSVSVLATSREPLGVQDEVALRVPSLSFPDLRTAATLESLNQYEAVRLFVDRATRASPVIVDTNEMAPAIAEICHRLDGIPLAIELAAARTRVLSPDQIAAGLGDVFRLLTSGARATLSRQRTLQASIDWSHELLDDRERTLFRRFSVFAGGFLLDAAEAVCAYDGIEPSDVLDLLTQLVDKSLVQVEDRKGTKRFRLLEAMRHYGKLKLAESREKDVALTRHLEYFFQLAERAAAELEAHGQHDHWIDVFSEEIDNVRAALDWNLEQPDVSRGLWIAGALWIYWDTQSPREGVSLLKAALDRPSSDPRARIVALAAAAVLSLDTGDPVGASAFAEESLPLSRELGDPKFIARALMSVGITRALIDPANAQVPLEESLEMVRSIDDPFTLVHLLGALTHLEFNRGLPARARVLLDEAIEVTTMTGNRTLAIRVWLFRGWALHLLTDITGARAALETTISLARSLQAPFWENWARSHLGVVDLLCGNVQRARQELDNALKEAVELQSVYGVAIAAWCAGQAECGAGDAAGAEAIILRGVPIQRMTGMRWMEAWSLAALAENAVMSGDLRSARAHVDEAAEAAGAVPSIIAWGRILHAKAALAWAEDDLEGAESAAHEALGLFAEAEHMQGVIEAIERLAQILAQLESFAEAARLLGAAQAARQETGYVRFPADSPRVDDAADRCRAALGDDAFESAYEAGLGLQIEEAVAYASRGRGSRKRPSSGWASLTPTEINVVRLVSDGMTNADIAKKLFISPRTVQSHLARVFNKLGVTSRTELAKEAIRRGIATT